MTKLHTRGRTRTRAPLTRSWYVLKDVLSIIGGAVVLHGLYEMIDSSFALPPM